MVKKKTKKTKGKTSKKSNNPNGRPEKVPMVDAIFSTVTQLAADGKTNAEIAEYLGVAETTIYQYKRKYEKFSKALENGHAIADDLVEQALFARAMGYWGEETKVFAEKGIVTDTITIKKWYPPDPTCLKLWLTNRRPNEWRDKKESEVNLSGNIFEALAKAIDDDE